MIRSGRFFALTLLLVTVSGLYAKSVDPIIKTSSTTTDVPKAGSIVFVDMEKLLGDIQKDFQAAQEASSKEFQATMEKMSKQRQDLEAKKKDVKDPKAIDAQIADLEKKGQEMAQSFQGKMQAKQQEAQKKAEDRVKKIEAVRAQYDWAAVCPTGATIAYDKALDVTDIVIKALSKKSKK